MAVEAHQHLLHAGQRLMASAGCTTPAPAPLGLDSAWYGGGYGKEVVAGGGAAAVGRQLLHQQQVGYRQPCVGMVAAPSTALGQYGQACASESGVTFGGGGAAAQEAVPRKRKRAVETPALGLGAADVAGALHQQLVDVDRLVLHHTAKIWAELAEQRRRHARQLVAAVEAAAAKRLRAKDEELERIGRLNWALEERLRSLCVEAQVWRDLAQSNEAAANALRGELQQALDAQARRGVGAGADDAASCCRGEKDAVGGGEEEVGSAAGGAAACRVCGEGAAEVLLLPCRHLCACAPCAAAAPACPACGCAKNGTVRVNFS